MARPQKSGMDYFPHDTDALTDEKIESLRMLYGNDGYAFYFIMLERIYRTEHFELDVSDAETRQILSRKIGVSDDMFEKMLTTSLNRKCFDRKVYEDRKCLTSDGIKKRANVVVEKRIKSKKDYENRVSATETTQETEQEIEQKIHKEEESKYKGKKKERKQENKEPIIEVDTRTKFEVCIDEFKTFRKSIKKPMSDHAVNLLLKNLCTLANDEDTKIKILEQSIVNGWSSVYAIKDNQSYGKNNTSDTDNIFMKIGREER